MKTIFITGASTGLGKATAKLFASKGWRVIATMRNPKNEIELNNIENITLLPLDVTNPDQIKETVQKAIALGNIDVIFNNAGDGLVGPMETVTDEQLVKQINTNLLGVIRVTQAFIPYFREKGNGLIVTTTSIGGLTALPFNSVYHATKWAIEGWSESLSFELNQFGIGVKTVSPGGIKTDFMSRSLETSSHPAYKHLIEQLYSKVNANNYSSAEAIADVVYEAVTDGKDTLRYVAGADANAIFAQRQQVGAEVFRKAIAQRFFGN
jgi:NAD(P)-dependent dehydrogenase (short-subunit alcohol dehydrogenase family)